MQEHKPLTGVQRSYESIHCEEVLCTCSAVEVESLHTEVQSCEEEATCMHAHAYAPTACMGTHHGTIRTNILGRPVSP